MLAEITDVPAELKVEEIDIDSQIASDELSIIHAFID
jgi:hypothetical protein